jgi:hypothetical protein
MVQRVTVSPSEVRGYGDIVSPKTTEDFTLFNSVLALSDGVYTLSFEGSTFLLTVSKSFVKSGETMNVTVTLTDENGDPVEGASIALYKITEDS